MPRPERMDLEEELLDDDEETRPSPPVRAPESPSAAKQKTPEADGTPAAEPATPGAAPDSSRRRESVESAAEAGSSESADSADLADGPESQDVAGAPPGDGTHGGGFGRIGKAERISLAVFAALALLGAILFFKFLYGGKSETTREMPARSLATPIQGELITLIEARHHWRDRHPDDPGRSDYGILPELILKAGPAPSKPGYVRVEFIDSEGELRGDVMTVKFENGKFVDSGRSERVSEDGTEVALACTEGFVSSTLFHAYLGNRDPRWALRIQEGADYSNGPWKTLGFVEIRNEKK
jgi:hypothetical protein